MYRVDTGTNSNLKDFLNTTDNEWINVIGTENGVMLIADSSEVFSVVQLQSDRAASDLDVVFRIKKELLKMLLLDRTMEMVVSKEEVALTFIGDKNRRSVTIPKHSAYTAIFNDKLQLMRKCTTQMFDAKALYKLYQVSKTLGSYVEVTNNVAGVISRDGTRIYKKDIPVPNMCLSSQGMNALYNCSSDWGCIQNYVFAIKGKFAVLVTQCRGSGLDMYELTEANELGSAAIATIDFSDVMYMVSKLRNCTVEIDLKTSEVAIVQNGVKFNVVIDETDLQINPNFNKTLPINSKIFLDVLPRLSVSVLTIYVKKNFYKLCCGDLIILCK